MNNDQTFKPDWASPPGDTITDILRERKLSIAKFARDMQCSIADAHDLLRGHATITISVARNLARSLGSSVEFWMSRDFQYREDIARVRSLEKDWLGSLPLSDMTRFGWIKPASGMAEEIKRCLDFFAVPSISAWHQTYSSINEMAAFKTSASFESHPAAVAAWLRQGEVESNAIRCRPWSSSGFAESLPKIRGLTRVKDPGRFVRGLRDICASNGVAVVVLRAPRGCRASGATRFLSKDKALLLLSFRYLSDDQFWFTFFHEAGHLLLHGEQVFIEGMGAAKTPKEKEADAFAQKTLVPTEFESELLALPVDSKAVIKFAKRLGISPGVIVGQLQHHGRLKHNYLNGLKRRFKWND